MTGMDRKVHSKLELEAPTHQPRVGKIRLFISGKKYVIHPVYNLYGGNKYGEVVHVSKFTPLKGSFDINGYQMVTVRASGDQKQTNVKVHRFIYECYHGIIPDGMVIDHIYDIRHDNRLCNLQLMTQQQNNKKAVKNHDYSNIAENFRNSKRVKAINLETNEISYYNSMTAAERSLGVHHGTISYCCRGIKNYKSGTSKKDGCKYAFEYA